MTTIALYRGRFDPPGFHHVAAVKAMLARFDRVVVMPWGPMADRPIDENIAPTLRAHLIDVALMRVDPRATVDLYDIEHESITGSLEVERKAEWARGNDVFHVVEAGSFAEDRARLHATARYAVLVPANLEAPPVPKADLESGRAVVVKVGADVDGAVMRKRLYAGQTIDDLVPPAVSSFIARYGLYRGMPRSTTRMRIEKPRLLLVADERNEKAMGWARMFKPWAVDDDGDPNLIVVFGGDGSMLHAIQQHWRKRIPFFGVNAGHLGFLLNDAADIIASPEAVAAVWEQPLLVRHMPMLHVELNTREKGWQSGLTFNDAWVERSTGQSAWLEVKVDGRVRLPKVVCDGVLVSTAAGSTAYARSMGATPLLADTQAWLLVGSNVMEPILWKSSLLSTSSVVEMRSLHVEKRPLTGYLHGVSLGEVTEMRARISRAGSVELAFLSDHDMAEKIARIQFPS